MTRFLRSHPYLTLAISSLLTLAGAAALFLPDRNDVSDSGMLLAYGGFLAFCVGLVGFMIVVFQPIPFTKDVAADWEIVKLEGRGRFVRRFLLGVSPLLIGILAPVVWNEDFTSPTFSILKIALLAIVLLVTTIAIALRFWKDFGAQHSVVSSEAAAGRTGAVPDKHHEH